MNSTLTVKLTSDTNYVPTKYRVVEMEPAATAATTYCVLEVVQVGWDTQVNYNNWVAHKVYAPVPAAKAPSSPIGYPGQGDYLDLAGRTQTGMQGTAGALSVTTLDQLMIYAPETPSSDM